MSATTASNIATQTKVVQVQNVSKVFKRDAFEVARSTMSPSTLPPANFWR